MNLTHGPSQQIASGAPRRIVRRFTGRRRAGFTLTELLVAVLVLIVILLAVSKIFSTTAEITAVGQGSEDVLQDITAIERLLRDDIARLSYEGVFVIRSYSVPNNVNGVRLLNPARDAEDRIRCDQLLFFRNGLQGSKNYRIGGNDSAKGEMIVSRTYWGHAYQLPEWDAFQVTGNNQGEALDADPDEFIFPWSEGTITPHNTLFRTGSGSDNFDSSSAGGSRSIRQPEARDWILSRQNVLLANDDQQDPTSNGKTVYLGDLVTARSVFQNDPLAGQCPQLRDGRVDGAATTLRDIRNRLNIVTDGEDVEDIWPMQRDFILDEMMYFPRAEKYPPSGHRVDQALSNHVMSTSCSYFKIEWTWQTGVGGVGYRCGSEFDYPGYTQEPDNDNLDAGTIWFGMDELGVPLDAEYRTRPLDVVFNDFGDVGAETVDPDNIEDYYVLNVNGHQVQVYEAVFGFNQTQPFADEFGWPTEYGCVPDDVDHDFGYTPWPSAIRITMTLHDSDTRLEGGRDVQFVIPLPRREGL